MIEKTNHTHNKKPAFRWVGIQGVHAFMQELKDERVVNDLAKSGKTQALGIKRTYSES